MGPQTDKFGLNCVLNFWRVTHFWRCLLETQVTSEKDLNIFGIRKKLAQKYKN